MAARARKPVQKVPLGQVPERGVFIGDGKKQTIVNPETILKRVSIPSTTGLTAKQSIALVRNSIVNELVPEELFLYEKELADRASHRPGALIENAVETTIASKIEDVLNEHIENHDSVDEQKRLLEGEVRRLNSELQGLHGSLESQVSDLNGQIATLRGDNNSKNDEISTLRGRLTGCEDGNRSIQRILEECRDEKSSIQRILEECRRNLKNCEDGKSSLQTEKSSIQRALQECEEKLTSLDSLESQVSALNGRNSSLNEEITTLRGEIATLTSTLRTKNEEIETLNNSKASLSSNLENCNNGFDGCKSNLETCKSELKECKEKIDMMKKASELLKDKHNVDVSQIQSALSNLSNELKDCMENSSDKTREITNLKNKIEAQMKHIQDVIHDGTARQQQLEQDLLDSELAQLDGIVERQLGDLVKGLSIMYKRANATQKFIIRATILSLKNYDPNDREKYVHIIEQISDIDGADTKKNGKKVIAEIELIRDLNMYEKMQKFFFL